MYDQPRANRPQTAMTFDQMLERVRYEGVYPTRERVDLAQCLPVEAALTLTAQIPTTEQLTGWGFVKDLAERTSTTPAVARRDTGAVLAVITRLAGPDLLARILRQLPGGYALLFGQAELRRPEPAVA
ncbi:DUF2267 domain-containing protein [Streptomyces yangpuensis]|uniref:DUF2267 domain-containing protein n=1 Tax=Streptomyces yangpuensis TaxID=1648182 RepID=UPI00371BF00E